MVPINTNMHIYKAFFRLRQELKESKHKHLKEASNERVNSLQSFPGGIHLEEEEEPCPVGACSWLKFRGGDFTDTQLLVLRSPISILL